MSAYALHKTYCDAARVTPDLPRLILGLILIELGFKVGLALMDAMLAEAPPQFVSDLHFGISRIGLLLQLCSFAALALSALFVTRNLHNRPVATLIGPPQQAWRDLWRVTWAGLAAFAAIEVLPPYYSLAGAEWNTPLLWLTTLPLAMIALLIQTGAEEVVYRGYLQQQLAARFDHPAIWLMVPNLLFAAAHWDPTGDLGAAQAYVIWAFFFGLAASDLTARSGTLGAAIGFHLANNTFAFLFFGTSGAPDSGLALLLFPASDTLLPPSAQDSVFDAARLTVELLIIAILWLAARIAIKR
ncbi:CPBP family intramembrane glutamic endopeptidase [Thalassobius sp. Cn5-15]|uniref:CPBP family intramembrane glutamic endopeptidase n=1 Tax=Thalassobius sp. Cn5-15 TaxID=2917763 RepID=UPI001EF1C5A7|nr:CPBP family intramembrane glutamic endopeptidase [Thalassobius sp. Cn5-15]MCG7494637.1 CPBP family intramembrane metalloprotease [Thalassobius sp. Cn5-15]